jgi:glycosyltransferase involved in cell wall biosynthesis
MKKKKIVFLYTELAEYFLSCVRALMQEPDMEILLFRWPVNKEAPFDFKFPEGLLVFDRKTLSDEEIMKKVIAFEPDMIYVSGWIDQGYLKVAKKFKKKIPVVLGLDNQWDGSRRQRLASLLSFYLIKPYFNRAWVPGEKQKTFAKKLGFAEDKISLGFYSADVPFFQHYYHANVGEKKKNFPKRFLYVGRYLPFKGVVEMWEAFAELKKEHPNAWELWCLGTGDLWDKRLEHPDIKHFGFVQPNEISKYIAETGVFVLPSHFEPWGVVVHEFAACGFPLICSEKVGSSSAFLKNGLNGFCIPANSKEALKAAFQKVMHLNQEELISMMEESYVVSNTISPATWVKEVRRIALDS